MQNKFTLLVLAVALSFTACRKDGGQVNQPGKDLELTATEQQKVSSDNQFTWKLFQAVAGSNTQPDNIFISPLSVNFAFGMTANGAAGETSNAIRNTMLFNNYSEEQVNNYYSKLITGLPLVDPTSTIKVANSIWYDKTLSVVPQFIQANTSAYNAKIQQIDFRTPSALIDINGWVSQQTNNKIPKIIDVIPADAAMYLINAVYFKSAWQSKFNTANTAKMPFTTNQGTTVQADFMRGEVQLRAYKDNTIGAGVYEMPYVNNKFSMVIIAPQEGKSLQQVKSAIDGAKMDDWLSKVQPATTLVNMPKFKFSFGKSLKNDLTNMGMGNAFSNQANFSRIHTTGGLAISDVAHKGFVEVNEEGTEAAAVTAVEFSVTSVAPLTATFNRPFLFAIREVKTGLILFVGAVNNPLLAGS